ncbi:Planctomycete cytochrome C [Microbulbifer aggregans]|uniref:Planctomycete cytochrome C n=1 Tax=Microbulbifer aggregans TaxID=1769779 RepID=A0A1C9W762_9GAMM|nr:SO2930 family diheme c-type cytochrome [Microbulbifer aggregans]AOS96987.1 Planctomycete cytochrome C [Microbulbifer aggregans]
MRKKLWGAVLAPLFAAALSGCDAPREQVTVFERDAVPDNLSDWHVVEAIDGELSLNDGVLPYDLNTALFTDYAHKLRTVWMPAGTAAQYGDENFEYPVGTVITKTFYYPKETGGMQAAVLRTDDYSRDYVAGKSGEALDLDNVRLMETRVLVKRADGWQALPYVWNAEQTDAVLEIAGDASRLQLANESGEATAFTYVVPDANQCAGCHADNHTEKAIMPLGPRARHLNKDYAYATGTENQLLHWQQVGYLSGLPEFAAIPKNVHFKDETASLEERARSYLDINCGHCHNPSGAADTSGLMLHHVEEDRRKLGLCKPPVAAGTGSGNRLFAIVPGEPEESILNFRVETTNPGAMMPELGRSLEHEEGTELLHEWVASMPGSCS